MSQRNRDPDYNNSKNYIFQLTADDLLEYSLYDIEKLILYNTDIERVSSNLWVEKMHHGRDTTDLFRRRLREFGTVNLSLSAEHDGDMVLVMLGTEPETYPYHNQKTIISIEDFIRKVRSRKHGSPWEESSSDFKEDLI